MVVAVGWLVGMVFALWQNPIWWQQRSPVVTEVNDPVARTAAAAAAVAAAARPARDGRAARRKPHVIIPVDLSRDGRARHRLGGKGETR